MAFLNEAEGFAAKSTLENEELGQGKQLQRGSRDREVPQPSNRAQGAVSCRWVGRSDVTELFHIWKKELRM